MASIFKKLLGIEAPSQSAQRVNLEKFLSPKKAFDIVPKSNTQAEHLVAHGQVIQNGKAMFDIRTAVVIKESEVEFSTNLGQIQNTLLGSAIVERLGHILDGKLVIFDNLNELDRVDVVYVTRKPFEWLNQKRFHSEIESHSKVKNVISPILDSSLRLPRPKKGLSYPESRAMAKDFVNGNLEIQYKLGGKLGASKYMPNLNLKK